MPPAQVSPPVLHCGSDPSHQSMSCDRLIIRQASISDAGLIAALGARTFEEAFGALNSREDMEQYLTSNFSEVLLQSQLGDTSSTFLLAYENDKVVGYAMLNVGNPPDSVTGPGPIELVRIYVEAEAIGQGYGANLMEACLENAKNNGHETIWLGVWEKNARAIAFYEKWAFKKVGLKEFILGSDVQKDIIMERPVDLRNSLALS